MANRTVKQGLNRVLWALATIAAVGTFEINASSYNYVGYLNKSDKPLAIMYEGQFVAIISTNGIVERIKKNGIWITP